jgi:YesN/AraC family two-component response regulator
MKEFTLAELKLVTSELSVLYVEDEPMIRDGLYASLKQLFKEVEVAEDGSIGWEMYQNSHFHLVITDISMPNMDGISMIQHIKHKNPEAHIIVTSAQNDADKLLTLINLGVDRFLTKPLSKINLIDTLYAVCSTIDNKRKLKMYQLDMVKKIRLLETQVKKERIKKKLSSPEVMSQDDKKSDYFSHILPEEIDELRDLNEELDADILMSFQNNRIDHAYIVRIAQRYLRYGSVLNTHSLFLDVGSKLQTMSKNFEAHEDVFMENVMILSELLESFNFTLISFRKNVWESNSQTPTFYNDSLLSDIEMINNILTQTQSDGEIEFF